MKRRLVIAVLIAACAFTGARAQTFEDYQLRQADLAALSSVFGELHHIRRTCDPRLEADVWRERMKKLVELEEPQPKAREQMVAAFNKGYRAAQQHFPTCTRLARDHAAARAAQGDAIIARLTAPLYEAIEKDENAPAVLAPVTPQQ